MISLFFNDNIPILEPMGREKHYRTRVSSFNLGADPACRIQRGVGGWFVTNGVAPDGSERCSDRIGFPITFVPDTSIKFAEGDDELARAYAAGASLPPWFAKAAPKQAKSKTKKR